MSKVVCLGAADVGGCRGVVAGLSLVVWFDTCQSSHSATLHHNWCKRSTKDVLNLAVTFSGEIIILILFNWKALKCGGFQILANAYKGRP